MYYSLARFYHDGIAAAAPALMATFTLVGFALKVPGEERYLPIVRALLRAVVLGSFLAAVFNPAWALVPEGVSERSVFGLETRLIGLSTSPNYIAVVAVLLFCFELSGALIRRAFDMANAGFASLAVIVAIWAQSRGVLMAMFVIALIAAFSRAGYKFARRSVLVSWLFLGFACLIVVVASVGAMVDDEVNELTTGRISIWSNILRNFASFLWFGASSRDALLIQNEAGNAHNGYLEALISGGVGFLLLTILLLVVVSYTILAGGERAALAGMLFLFIAVQFAFGTPLRAFSLSWNFVVLVLLVGECGRCLLVSRVRQL
ncbi:O-antigen ligase family protein [Dietzia maris]